MESGPADDFELARRAATAVGAVMLSKTIDEVREKVTDATHWLDGRE